MLEPRHNEGFRVGGTSPLTRLVLVSKRCACWARGPVTWHLLLAAIGRSSLLLLDPVPLVPTLYQLLGAGVLLPGPQVPVETSNSGTG